MYNIPERILVKPIIFIPQQGTYTHTHLKPVERALQLHIEWAQDTYNKLLGSTFDISDTEVIVGNYTIDEYYKTEGRGAPLMASEILNRLEYSRWNCPYIFCTLVISENKFPYAAGRCFNGGLNTGGGFCYMSSYNLNVENNLQSIIRHELGHTFGLVHSEAYGKSMDTDTSIMSYNPNNRTTGFIDTNPTLSPEDCRAISYNKRVFPDFHYDPPADIAKELVLFDPMEIPEHPLKSVSITVNENSAYRSNIRNIEWSKKLYPASNPYNYQQMWHSPVTDFVFFQIRFPSVIDIEGISVHTGYNNKTHVAKQIQAHGQTFEGGTDVVIKMPHRGPGIDVGIFTDESQKLVLRGFRYFTKQGEIFPPCWVHEDCQIWPTRYI